MYKEDPPVRVVGFQRSGNFLLCLTLYRNFQDFTEENSCARDFVHNTADYYLGLDIGRSAKLIEGGRIGLTHLPYNEIKYKPESDKLIYIIRDPRPTLLSFYKYTNCPRTPISLFIDEILIKRWKEVVDSYDCCFTVRYEEIIDPSKFPQVMENIRSTFNLTPYEKYTRIEEKVGWLPLNKNDYTYSMKMLSIFKGVLGNSYKGYRFDDDATRKYWENQFTR